MLNFIKSIGRKILKRKRKKVRQYISLKQDINQISLEGKLRNESYIIKQLWLVSRFTNDIYKIDASEDSNEFIFNLNLLKLANLFSSNEDVFDLHLLVKVPQKNFNDKKIKKMKSTTQNYIDEKGIEYFEYPIRLGRFENTQTINLKPVMINNDHLYLYLTTKGNIALAVNYELKHSTKIQIDYLKSKKHQIDFGGKIYTKSSKIIKIELIMLGREMGVETKIPISKDHMGNIVKKRFGLNRYKYKTSIELNEIFQNTRFDTDVYDFYFDIEYHDIPEVVRIRVGKPRFKARFFTKESEGQRGETVFAVSPYYTVKRFNLSLQIDRFDKQTYNYLKRISRWTWLLRNFYKRKDIWIVGERPYKAQDTGYHFFKYMRETYPKKEVYYVIEEDSPELKNIEHLGNILFYKSKKHIKYVLMAKRIISSHHPDYLYPLRTKKFLQKVKAKKVFMQHGVLGTKNIEHFYGKNSPSFSTDLFLVSSDYEKDIVISDFGYHRDEVIVTGLSRFDSLLKDDIKPYRQLLIIPTWREWLVQEDLFIESEYFKKYKELVNSPDLHKLASLYNFEVVFCLHPNMQKFTSLFKDAPVKIINQGEIDVQVLMKQSAMMITDYSSVAFDFSFLNKPILYYQFDRKRFIGKRGSHLDLDNDLPGDIVYDLDKILSHVRNYAESDFKMKENYANKASKFLKYKDQKSSERIYQAISTEIKNKPYYKTFLETELYRTLFKRFRKSGKYFPTMKLFYKIAKKVLPVDDKLILFESGIGKQYSDSPRNIYEEILRRNLDYKKIWVSNKNIHFSDPDTKRINRLSPSYYYYLAKSKIWVNNQNFPTYIEKREQTTYIQTWHGTPLKKMLHDIENILGRSDDYLERVSNAVENWDYLISPSPYASKAFRSAFKYDGKILETGYPRNDIFYDDKKSDISEKVRNRLELPKKKKVILYAPTFRDNQASVKNKFSFELPMDLNLLKEMLGEEYIILLRMHVVVSSKIKIEEELQDFVMNVSNYSDIQELLLITDILVTDYSSVMFDFANTEKPILFYTYDLETYRDEVRGFYMDFEEEAPGPLVRTTDELIESIKSINDVEQVYRKKYEAFYTKYCLLEDGSASRRIVARLFD